MNGRELDMQSQDNPMVYIAEQVSEWERVDENCRDLEMVQTKGTQMIQVNIVWVLIGGHKQGPYLFVDSLWGAD